MPITTTIADRIAEIVLDVPPVNAFDSETWMSLPGIITDAASNPEVNCVLIRAEGRGFCGGVDSDHNALHGGKRISACKAVSIQHSARPKRACGVVHEFR